MFRYVILKLFYFHFILYVLLYCEAHFIAILHVWCDKQTKLKVGTVKLSYLHIEQCHTLSIALYKEVMKAEVGGAGWDEGWMTHQVSFHINWLKQKK